MDIYTSSLRPPLPAFQVTSTELVLPSASDNSKWSMVTNTITGTSSISRLLGFARLYFWSKHRLGIVQQYRLVNFDFDIYIRFGSAFLDPD